LALLLLPTIGQLPAPPPHTHARTQYKERAFALFSAVSMWPERVSPLCVWKPVCVWGGVCLYPPPHMLPRASHRLLLSSTAAERSQQHSLFTLVPPPPPSHPVLHPVTLLLGRLSLSFSLVLCLSAIHLFPISSLAYSILMLLRALFLFFQCCGS
jgi:hypothetical protein